MLVLTVSFVIALTLVTMVVRRPDRRRLGLRLAMTILAVCALALMALQPRWLSKPGAAAGLLLTQGTSLEHVRQFADTTRLKYEIYVLNDTLPAAFRRKAISIPDVGFLKRNFPQIELLHVFGHGLSEYEIAELAPLYIVAFTSPPGNGLVDISWPRTITIGEKLNVQGSVALEKGSGWLALSGPAGAVDSLNLSAQETLVFHLQATPRDTGRFLFTLDFKSTEGEEEFSETIDVTVDPIRKLKILILEGAPRFETKFLKNGLAEQGHSVVVRTTVSQDRTRTESLNLNFRSYDLQRLGGRLFSEFDILVIDLSTLSTLTRRQGSSLKEAIRAGLGALIIPNRLENHLKQQNLLTENFEFHFFPDIAFRTVKLQLDDKDRPTTEIRSDPFEIKSRWGIQPIFQDKVGRLLAAGKRFGNGWLATSLVRNSYEWILEGHPEFHAAYWMRLLDVIARREQETDVWQALNSGPALINQPYRLQLSSVRQAPIATVVSDGGDPDKMYLKQDRVNPLLWRGSYWPRRSGWHRVYVEPDDDFHFYVHHPGEWTALQQSERLQATRRYETRPRLREPGAAAPVDLRMPIPSLLFFGLFIACCATLWIETKLAG
ncbi:MAG: hypothetical protein ACE5IR_21170 [bacterium]